MDDGRDSRGRGDGYGSHADYDSRASRRGGGNDRHDDDGYDDRDTRGRSSRNAGKLARSGSRSTHHSPKNKVPMVVGMGSDGAGSKVSESGGGGGGGTSSYSSYNSQKSSRRRQKDRNRLDSRDSTFSEDKYGRGGGGVSGSGMRRSPRDPSSRGNNTREKKSKKKSSKNRNTKQSKVRLLLTQARTHRRQH